MTIRALIVCVLGHVMAVTLSAQDANKQDLDKLQGDWIRVSEQIGGNSTPAADLQELKVTIKGNQWDVWLTRTVVKKDAVTITLDASKEPKIFDRTTTGGQKIFGRTTTSGQKTVPGIYKLEGDTLTICTAWDVRPKEFKTTVYRGRLTVFKRVAGSAEAAAPPAPAAIDPTILRTNADVVGDILGDLLYYPLGPNAR